MAFNWFKKKKNKTEATSPMRKQPKRRGLMTWPMRPFMNRKHPSTR